MFDDINEIHPLFKNAPSTTEFKNLRKRIIKNTREAIEQYGMIERGARWLVCLSGGKDSYTLLAALYELKWRGLLPVDILACNLDQGQPGFPATTLPEFLKEMEIPHRIEFQDTYSIVKELTPEGKTTCPVCSRLRRGILYNHAQKIGATKIALGHHLDDVVETLLLNMFYGAKLKAMPAKLRSDDGRNILIRPLFYCRESLIARWSEFQQHPIIPCNLCGSQDNLQRQVIKQMLAGWDAEHPGRVDNIGRSINNVTLSHLGDRRLFDFAALQADSNRIDVTEVR
jgi:tRNA 2-thiocytidine biosynthesis protein TtcA